MNRHVSGLKKQADYWRDRYMEMRKIAELSIQSQEDRLAVASILVKNGYTVRSDKRKKTPSVLMSELHPGH